MNKPLNIYEQQRPNPYTPPEFVQRATVVLPRALWHLDNVIEAPRIQTAATPASTSTYQEKTVPRSEATNTGVPTIEPGVLSISTPEFPAATSSTAQEELVQISQFAASSQSLPNGTTVNDLTEVRQRQQLSEAASQAATPRQDIGDLVA